MSEALVAPGSRPQVGTIVHGPCLPRRHMPGGGRVVCSKKLTSHFPGQPQLRPSSQPPPGSCHPGARGTIPRLPRGPFLLELRDEPNVSTRRPIPHLALLLHMLAHFPPQNIMNWAGGRGPGASSLSGELKARLEEGQSTYPRLKCDKVRFAGHKAGVTLQTT